MKVSTEQVSPNKCIHFLPLEAGDPSYHVIACHVDRKKIYHPLLNLLPDSVHGFMFLTRLPRNYPFGTKSMKEDQKTIEEIEEILEAILVLDAPCEESNDVDKRQLEKSPNHVSLLPRLHGRSRRCLNVSLLGCFENDEASELLYHLSKHRRLIHPIHSTKNASMTSRLFIVPTLDGYQGHQMDSPR